MNKPILAFPYHDPDGWNNLLLKSTLPLLKELFSEICISATPATVESNSEFLTWLESQGCFVWRNEKGTTVGDHYRHALHVAVQKDQSHIMFVMIDRLLFALNTEHKQECVQHVGEVLKHDVMLLERTERAWSTHPQNYREIEQAANQMGRYILGKEVELGSCGMSFSSEIARRILDDSVGTTFSAGAEWILLFFLWNYDPYIQKCDWLTWEDPFIEKKSATELKLQREADPHEVLKRIHMNADFVALLKEERFLNRILF